MQRSLIFKLAAIGFLCFVLLIALVRIGGVIGERQALRDKVVQDIARSSSYSQRLTGPLLVVPYTKTEYEWKEDTQTKQRYRDSHEVSGQLYFLPEVFRVDGKIQSETRSRGIYEARLYHANNKISGRFDLPTQLGLGSTIADYRFEPAFLAMGISDIRGIENALTLVFDGQTIKFEPGARTTLLGAGVHAMLGQLNNAGASLEFSFDLRLQGTEQFDVTPVGRDTQVNLSSDWPHPSFVGEYLPVERSVDAKGFSARWQTSFFATNLEEALQTCLNKASCEQFNARHFGVSLIDPVDQYLKSERAIKYSLLFIALTFAGFFLFEVLKKLAVHPIQYGLVGLALALFYLLLLSLAEHVGFALAYAMSATGCVVLIGFYIVYVLHSLARGAGFATGLAALYGLLYCLLNAEDYALLMGAILLFGLLTVVMVLTRNVNWFNLGGQKELSE
ncbi:MAG: cell envelope integrity protein CreD [Steroidobacteraceae bacterium]